MPENLIRGRRVEASGWTIVMEPGTALPRGPVFVPLSHWSEHRTALAAHAAPVGVWLAPGEDPEALLADLPHLAAIAVLFPKFTDGRGYSTAVLLRRRGFRGELRAFGDLGRDQLFYLSRVGFDAFDLRPGTDLADALAAFDDFSLAYQGATDDPRPLFRREVTLRG